MQQIQIDEIGFVSINGMKVFRIERSGTVELVNHNRNKQEQKFARIQVTELIEVLSNPHRYKTA